MYHVRVGGLLLGANQVVHNGRNATLNCFSDVQNSRRRTSRWHNMGRAGYKRVRSRFTAAKMNVETSNLYRALIANRPQSEKTSL